MPAIHRMTDSPEYITWNSIKQRVLNTRARYFCDYGGRGVTICDWWRTSFVNFYADMGPRTSLKYSIERRDNNGHYSCGHCAQCIEKRWEANCYWALEEQQQNNRRDNTFLTLNGKRLSISQWARLLNIPKSTLAHRKNPLGWSDERALTEPIHKRSTSPRSADS